MDIRELDRGDEATVHRYWQIGKEAVAERPYAFTSPWESAWLSLSHDHPSLRQILLGAYDGDQMWGTAWLGLPQLDNTHQIWVGISVHPERRREGIGSRLLTQAEVVARREGRRLFGAEAYAPPDDTSPGLLFAQARGFEVGIEDGMKVVDLFETEELWDGLAAQIAPFHSDYRLVTFHNVVPDELIAGYCELMGSFVSEAPMGELDVEPESWDAARVRQKEADMRHTGRDEIGTIAVDANGEVVAFTELVVNLRATWRGFQGGTLVRPGDRGHRLGLALKIANQRAVRAAFPDLKIVLTGNAGVNDRMNAVNDLLGFEIVERCVEMQRPV